MPLRRLLFWIGLFAGLPALVATFCTYTLWGYPFTPPSIGPLLPQTVDAIGYYALDIAPDEQYTAFNTAFGASLYWQDDPYNRPSNAVGLNITPLADDTLAQVADALQAQDWRLFAPDIDYSAALPIDENGMRAVVREGRTFRYGLPRGYIIQGAAPNGTPLVFVSASSMNAVDGNDDHYYYYEALFENTGGTLTLRNWHTFAYDVAGIEFAQWPTLYMAMLLMFAFAYLIGLPLITFNRWRKQRRISLSLNAG